MQPFYKVRENMNPVPSVNLREKPWQVAVHVSPVQKRIVRVYARASIRRLVVSSLFQEFNIRYV